MISGIYQGFRGIDQCILITDSDGGLKRFLAWLLAPDSPFDLSAQGEMVRFVCASDARVERSLNGVTVMLSEGLMQRARAFAESKDSAPSHQYIDIDSAHTVLVSRGEY